MLQKKKRKKGVTIVDCVAILFIIVLIGSIVFPAIMNSTIDHGQNRSEIKATISVIEQALSMYHADLNVYPPDRNQSVKRPPQNANECSPDNRAVTLGEFDTSLSNYSADSFMRYLDGDTSNDSAPGYDDVSARPLDTYIDINEDNLEPNKDGMPVIVTRFNKDINDPSLDSTIKYNEFDSEQRTRKFQKESKHPRETVVRFDSFQLYSEAGDLEEEYPERFLTNFRDN